MKKKKKLIKDIENSLISLLMFKKKILEIKTINNKMNIKINIKIIINN